MKVNINVFVTFSVTCDIWTTQDLKKELNSFYTVTITADDGKITTIQDLGLTLTSMIQIHAFKNVRCQNKTEHCIFKVQSILFKTYFFTDSKHQYLLGLNGYRKQFRLAEKN